MKSKSIKAALLGAMAFFAVAPAAFATSVTGTAVAETAFNTFAATVIGWLKGGLGIGIALIALLVGAGIGISNGTAMPMIAGVVIAAGFAFLPQILDDLVQGAGAALVPLNADLAALAA